MPSHGSRGADADHVAFVLRERSKDGPHHVGFGCVAFHVGQHGDHAATSLLDLPANQLVEKHVASNPVRPPCDQRVSRLDRVHRRPESRTVQLITVGCVLFSATGLPLIAEIVHQFPAVLFAELLNEFSLGLVGFTLIGVSPVGPPAVADSSRCPFDCHHSSSCAAK